MASDTDDDPPAAPPQLGGEAAAPAAPEPADQTVKQLLDAKTRAELERWFGLPSFQELAERGEPQPADLDLEAARERRAKAIAAVDPELVEAHRRRIAVGDTLIKFQAIIDVRIDPSMTQVDLAQIERQQQAIAEPREVDIPHELRDDLAECAPQAILRDLHRPELYFDKLFEIVDMAAEQRFDIVAAVDDVMRTSWKLPPFGGSLAAEARALVAELKEDRMRSIAHLLPDLPNRRVREP
jgi:hypothetical protein